MKAEMKAQSKCALTNRYVCFEYVVKGTGNQNSCSVSCLLLLQNVLDRTGDSLPHHALLSVPFVCMTLLCSAAISVRAFDSSASSSLTFSSEKIFLQRKKRESSKLEILIILGKKKKSQQTSTLVKLKFNHLFSMTSSPNM